MVAAAAAAAAAVVVLVAVAVVAVAVVVVAVVVWLKVQLRNSKNKTKQHAFRKKRILKKHLFKQSNKTKHSKISAKQNTALKRHFQINKASTYQKQSILE